MLTFFLTDVSKIMPMTAMATDSISHPSTNCLKTVHYYWSEWHTALYVYTPLLNTNTALKRFKINRINKRLDNMHEENKICFQKLSNQLIYGSCLSAHAVLVLRLYCIHTLNLIARVRTVAAPAILYQRHDESVINSVCFAANSLFALTSRSQWEQQQERQRSLSTERTGHVLSGVTCRAVSCVVWFCKSALQLHDPGHTHAWMEGAWGHC